VSRAARSHRTYQAVLAYRLADNPQAVRDAEVELLAAVLEDQERAERRPRRELHPEILADVPATADTRPGDPGPHGPYYFAKVRERFIGPRLPYRARAINIRLRVP
jgi:hypothetical protein